MGCEPDPWARKWLEERRAAGETGLTVEKRGGVHYVRWATTEWDPALKKRRKVSEYRGVLGPDGTLRPPERRRARADVSDVKDSGSARLLAHVSGRIIRALTEAFPDDFPEIAELAFARCLGRGALSKAGRCWKRLEDVLGLRPATSPAGLSRTLERVGSSRERQDMFFRRLCGDEGEMAVDMSVIFSRARGASMCKRGYSRFSLTCPQFNLLLACGLRTGRPAYMRVVPGNVKEGGAVSMLDEFCIPEGTVLVMDRGYWNRGFLDAVRGRGLDYAVPVRRNSRLYGLGFGPAGGFAWQGSAVVCGRAALGDGLWAYRFDNMAGRNAEAADSLAAGKGLPDMSRAGSMVIESTLDAEPEEIYRMFKARCSVENCFDTAKNDLDADRMYMRDGRHVCGFLFVTFVAMAVRFEISALTDAAGISSRYSPEDVLDVYASMKSFPGSPGLRQEVPADLRDLDARLGLFMYSTQEDRDRALGVKRRRGRRPKADPDSKRRSYTPML